MSHRSFNGSMKKTHRLYLDTVPASVRNLIPSSARNVSCTKVFTVIVGIVVIFYILSWDTDAKRSNKLQITASNEAHIYSQRGEDGVLKSIFEQIGVTERIYVEFGTENGEQINTRALREQDGWRGLLMDGSNENGDINLHKELIFHSNIVELFRKHLVPTEFDLLSTDTDWKDFWVSKAILDGGYRPRVIVSETNSSFRKDLAITVPMDAPEDYAPSGSGYYFGATPMALTILYQQFGYSLVYCEHSGNNCFWVRNEDLSRDDVRKFNEKRHILSTIHCATYGADQGAHQRNLDESRKWVQIVPPKGDAEFVVQPFEMSAAELNENRCF